MTSEGVRFTSVKCISASRSSPLRVMFTSNRVTRSAPITGRRAAWRCGPPSLVSTTSGSRSAIVASTSPADTADSSAIASEGDALSER